MWILAALLACKPSPTSPEDAVTFHQDVAPVLDAHCMQCHGADGLAPMSFDTYDETALWAEAIVVSTGNRSMPPKQVVADGSCGDFVDEWWLSEAELEILSDWVGDGKLEGEEQPRAEQPEPPSITPTETMQTPDFEPHIVGSENARFDEYRCFPMNLEDVGRDRFLTGYDVHPGNEAIVHHVIGVFVDPDAESRSGGLTNIERMVELDLESPDRLGWPCFTGAGDGVDYLSDPIAWAPGQGATNFPEGHGVRIPEGTVFVAQVHYNLADAANIGTSDITEIELVLEDEVDEEIRVLYVDFLLGFGDSLPAGREAFSYDTTFTMSDLGVPLVINVVGVMPHMHGRGVKLDFSVGDECLVDVDQWDFGWQFVYFYEEPIRVRPSDEIRLSCTYDTRDATEPVTAGWGTRNEMCLAVVYATL